MIKLIPIFFSIFLFGFGGNYFTPKTLTGFFDTSATTNIQNGTANWDFSTSNFSYDTTNYTQTKFVSGSTAAFGRAGSINGAGTVTVSGTQIIGGLLFDTVPSGNYTITSGTLSCGYPSCSYTANVSGTIGSDISGSKKLIKEGLQNLTLTANLSFTGTADINAGTLTLSSGGTNTWKGSLININGASTLNIIGTAGAKRYDFPATTFNFNNVGGGSITVSGVGTNWVQFGAFTFATNGGARNTISGPPGLNTNNTGGTIFSVIPGLDPISDLDVSTPLWNQSQGITKTGGGILRMIANNTYTVGTLTNSAGTLALGDGVVTGNIIPAANLITNNATLTYNTPDTITHSGAISGTGSFNKYGTGVLTLTAVNSYGGGTNVWDGTLQASTTVSAFPGNVNIAAGATAWLNVAGTNPIHSNTFSGAGTLKVTAGGSSSDTSALSGNLSGLSGTLDVNPNGGGGGKVAISTGTQGNTMPAGSLVRVQPGGTIFYPNALNYAAGVELNGGTTGETIGNLRVDNGNVTGPVSLLANSTIGSWNVTGTISGVISGAFAITKEASGNIIFTNNNTYTGTTTISGGTLTLGDGTKTGNIIPTANLISANAALVYDTPSIITHSGTISGTGSLRKDGAGTLTITESNPYSGATTVSAGTLSLSMTANDRNASSGYTISSGATLNVNVPSGTARICNTNPTITGTGTFTKTGGLQFYMADNTNNKQANFNMGAGGLIDVQGGMIYSASTLATNLADLTIATGAMVTINTDDVVGNPTAYFDELSGAGTIRQHGAGPARTLSVGNNNGTAIFTGVVEDGGGVLSFIKAGNGTQILSGANTYSGTTSINGGLLGGSGSSSSAATLGASGTIFGGTGSGSAGTATFGSITFSSSTSAMNIYSNGTNLSKVVSNGACTMGGAAFNLIQAGPTTSQLVLDCANAPTGEFPTLNNSSGNIATLHQVGNDYYIARNGVLDLVPGNPPSGAYSLRKIRTGHAGNAIRVRRSSDNTFQDIGFTANGDLDVSALTTFVGAGNNGFVHTWYDQSTHVRNATQATAANQPQIVNAGAVVTSSRTGIPSMSFSPNQWLDTGTNLQTMTNAGRDGSVIAVIKSGATSNAAFGAYGPGGVNRWSAHVIWQDNMLYMDLGDVATNRVQINAAGNVNNWRRYSFLRSGDTATLRWSGSQQAQKTTASAQCTATGNFLIGYASNPDGGLSSITGNISEFFIFPTGLSEPDLSILESSQGSYWQVP